MSKNTIPPPNHTARSRFDTLTTEAKLEGVIGVEDEKLIHNTLKKPVVYRKLVRDRLTEIDSEYTPLTHTLFTELYTYATVA